MSLSTELFILDQHGLHFSPFSLHIHLICSTTLEIIQVFYPGASCGVPNLKTKICYVYFQVQKIKFQAWKLLSIIKPKTHEEATVGQEFWPLSTESIFILNYSTFIFASYSIKEQQ